VITDPGSSRVKAVTRLTQKDARQETGLFLLEGPQGLKELVHYPEIVHEVFVTEAASERYAEQLDQLLANKCSVEVVSDKVQRQSSEINGW